MVGVILVNVGELLAGGKSCPVLVETKYIIHGGLLVAELRRIVMLDTNVLLLFFFFVERAEEILVHAIKVSFIFTKFEALKRALFEIRIEFDLCNI